MGSEARKPLIASLAYLAIYLTIILAVTTFLIIGGIKEEQSKQGPGTSEQTGEPEKNNDQPANTPEKRKKLKIAIKTVLACGKMNNLPDYVNLHDKIKNGEYLEPKPQTLLEDFQRDFYMKIAEEEEEEEENGSKKVDMQVIKEISSSPSSCRLFELTDTFGLPKSSGYFSYYNETYDTNLFVNYSKFEEYINDKFDILKEDIVEISERPTCQVHLKLVKEKTITTFDSAVFSDLNIKSLTDHLVNTISPWELPMLTNLNIPSGFGLIIGLEPDVPPPAVPVIENIIGLFNIKKNVGKIENVFKEKDFKTFYYGNIILKSKDAFNFNSIQDYAAFMKDKGYKFIDNVEMISPVYDSDSDSYAFVKLKIHYAAKKIETLKSLKLKTISFVDSIFDKSLASGFELEFNFFKFIKENVFCILFVFEGISDSQVDPFFILNQKIINIFHDYIEIESSSYLFLFPFFYGQNLDCAASIDKLVNYDSKYDQHRTAYNFSLLCDNNSDAGDLIFHETEIDDYIIEFTDNINETTIINSLIQSFADEHNLKLKWQEICRTLKKSTRIIIVPKNVHNINK